MTSEDPPDHRQTGPPPSVHGGDGRFVRTVESAERDAEAARLRTRGWSYRQIAAEMEWADHTSAMDAVKRAMTAVVVEDGATARQTELERLDLLVKKVTAVMESRHLAFNNKGVVEDPEGGGWLTDDGPALAAARVLQGLSESRRKLLGLDAETKVSVSGAVTYEVVGVDPAAIAGTTPAPGETEEPT